MMASQWSNHVISLYLYLAHKLAKSDFITIALFVSCVGPPRAKLSCLFLDYSFCKATVRGFKLVEAHLRYVKDKSFSR